jgi:hypothetical protein
MHHARRLRIAHRALETHQTERTGTSMLRNALLLFATLVLASAGSAYAQPIAPKDPREVVVVARGGVSVTLHEVDAQVMALDNPERLEEVV